MERRHDRPAVDFHVRSSGNDAAQVNHEFTGRMDDVREVDVLTLRDVVIERDANRLLLRLLLIHE